MADIYVLFETVNSISNCVTNALFTDDTIIGTANPTFTSVTVDAYNADAGTVEISSVFYPIEYTKSDGIGGLQYDSALQTYYTTQAQELKNLEFIIFNDLGADDTDFTGLTQEECMDLIDANTTNRQALTGETDPDYPILQSQLCPSNKACFLTFEKYDSTFIYVTARAEDGTEYIANYDSSQTAGSRWSGWDELTNQGGGSSDPISDNDDFTTLTDSSFTGLTQEQCLDAIFTDTSDNTRITVETDTGFSTLQTQFCPSSKDCILIFFKQGNLINVTAKGLDNTDYIGMYDNSQTSGSRWSSWTELTNQGGGTSDPIADNDNFDTLVDADFTGLTAEQCLDDIYTDTAVNTRITIETDTGFSTLQTQFCPSSKECILVFFKDSTYIRVEAKALDNTEYIGTYDNDLTAGSRWSGWTELTNQGGGGSDAIADDNNFATLVDSDFTGLTAEGCMDDIYTDMGTDTRISIETETDFPILEAQFNPNGDPAYLEFFRYDSTFIYVTAKMQNNTMYIGTYDYSQSAGSRWSGWSSGSAEIITINQPTVVTDNGTSKTYTIPQIDSSCALIAFKGYYNNDYFNDAIFSKAEIDALFNGDKTSIRSAGDNFQVKIEDLASENVTVAFAASSSFILDYVTIYKFSTVLNGGIGAGGLVKEWLDPPHSSVDANYRYYSLDGIFDDEYDIAFIDIDDDGGTTSSPFRDVVTVHKRDITSMYDKLEFFGKTTENNLWGIRLTKSTKEFRVTITNEFMRLKAVRLYKFSPNTDALLTPSTVYTSMSSTTGTPYNVNYAYSQCPDFWDDNWSIAVLRCRSTLAGRYKTISINRRQFDNITTTQSNYIWWTSSYNSNLIINKTSKVLGYDTNSTYIDQIALFD